MFVYKKYKVIILGNTDFVDVILDGTVVPDVSLIRKPRNLGSETVKSPTLLNLVSRSGVFHFKQYGVPSFGITSVTQPNGQSEDFHH